jgi:hypothetical protein
MPQTLTLPFPTGGLSKGGAYSAQPKNTAYDARNVRPISTLESRLCGGSRPGLVQSHVPQLGGPVRMMAPMVLSLDDGFSDWTDGFTGLSLSGSWTQASWSSDMPLVLPAYESASIDTSVDSGDAVLEALEIDNTQPYVVEMFLVPFSGTYSGTYTLYLRMDNTTPDAEQDGAVLALTMEDDAGTYSGSLTVYVAGVPTVYAIAEVVSGTSEPSWLSAVIDGDTITVYWRGAQILSQEVSASAGERVGFGLTCTIDGSICLANVFRVQYYATANGNTSRNMLVVSADGALYKESFSGILEAVSTNATLRSDVHLEAAQSGQVLYIADYGDVCAEGTDGSVAGTAFDATGVDDWTALGISEYDHVVVIDDVTGTAVAGMYEIDSIASGAITLKTAAGTGTCAYRIERGLKVYDPDAGTLALVLASTGSVPLGCPHICRYLDRLALAGSVLSPNVYYMSRVADPLDWDYSQEDSQRAYLGGSGEAGVPGTGINTLIPHTDDYLLLGCDYELWRLRGDPAYDGALDSLSRVNGIMGGGSWCFGPSGEVVFLSAAGVCALDAGGESFPSEVSRELLPKDLVGVSANTNCVLSAYDHVDNGAWLFVTPISEISQTHWWIDWKTRTFWPTTFDNDHEPTALCTVQAATPEESGVVLGCRDGYLRRFSAFAATDCGTEFESYVVMGPLITAPMGTQTRVQSMAAVVSAGSGDIEWGLRIGETPEIAASADAVDTGDWVAGINYRVYPAGAGQAIALCLTGSGLPWSFEYVTIDLSDPVLIRRL